MPEKANNKDRLREITASIETGIQELFQSDKYRQYLSVMSRFHNYSVNNTMLIYLQKPEATLVAGYQAWEKKFSRHVAKGEKSIKIIAPTPVKKKIQQEKLDPDTRLPLLDRDGNPIMEEKTVKIPYYKPVSVFDVSQTFGKPLPTLAAQLDGSVERYEDFLTAIHRASPVPIFFKPLQENTDGFYSLTEKSITIREGMSETQTVCAAIHEMAHAILHGETGKGLNNTERYAEVEAFGIPALFSNGRVSHENIPNGMYRYELRGSDEDPGKPVAIEDSVLVNHAGTLVTAKPLPVPEAGCLDLTEEDGIHFIGGELSMREFWKAHKKDQRTQEVEAESVSFAVCAYYGIATEENSFGYIAGWSKGKELKELRDSLETINKTASTLITDIDRNLAEICQERSAAQQEKEALYLLDGNTYLYVQQCDDGWDYTLYDKATMRQFDGGQLDMDGETVQIEAARDEILKFHALSPETISEESLDRLEDLLNGNAVKAQEPPMPDPSITLDALKAYGYSNETMLPLSKERAIELFAQEYPVYILHEGNSEVLAFYPEDIEMHTGIFGVSREDWEQVQDTLSKNRLNGREQQFLDSSKDCYLIYQLKRTDDTAKISYMNTEWLASQGIAVDRRNYDVVYAGTLPKYGTTEERLDQLYEQFNINHPLDFTGRSLSISDIVALKQGDEVSCYYVDSIGFTPAPQFLPVENYLKTAELSLEDDYGMIDGVLNNGPKEPTVAELETKGKAGQSISLTDLAAAAHREREKEDKAEKKPSVLAKLKSYQAMTATETQERKGAEREL